MYYNIKKPLLVDHWSVHMDQVWQLQQSEYYENLDVRCDAVPRIFVTREGAHAVEVPVANLWDCNAGDSNAEPGNSDDDDVDEQDMVAVEVEMGLEDEV